jgi:hypothetical protein
MTRDIDGNVGGPAAAEANGNVREGSRHPGVRPGKRHRGSNPARGAQPSAGNTFGRPGGPPWSGQPRKGGNVPRGHAGPIVRTTLTIPGAIPEGLPGTSGPRPKGPAPGKPHRGKPPRHRQGHDDDRGNRAPPAPAAPVLADEDFNR